LSGTNGRPVATGYPPTPPPDRRTRLQRYALGLVAALFMIAATISLVTISPRKPIALTRPAQINLSDNTRSIASAELANKELDAAAISSSDKNDAFRPGGANFAMTDGSVRFEK